MRACACVPHTSRARFRGISTGYINACIIIVVVVIAMHLTQEDGWRECDDDDDDDRRERGGTLQHILAGIMRVTVFGSESVYTYDVINNNICI